MTASDADLKGFDGMRPEVVKVLDRLA